MNFSCSTISKAIANNDVESFNELLNKRQRIDIPDNLGFTSLHVAAKKIDINPIIMDTLLNHPDVEINGKTVEGFTSLYIACNMKIPNLTTIQKLLEHGADTNIGDMEDVTPIHQAVKFGQLELVQLLIKYKSEINCKDFNSYTPLHISIEHNHHHITKYLLEQGADLKIGELHGLNPLMFAIEKCCPYAHILVGSTEYLNKTTNDNLTALQLAIKRDNFRIAELLILNGADLYLNDPLLYALKHVNFPIFNLIWGKIDPKRLRKYDEIFRKILIGCNVSGDFRFIKIVINDPRLECDLYLKKGVLAFIFYKGTNLNEQYTEEYFRNLKIIYEKFFECLILQGIRMSSADVESFIVYFNTCPYRINILQRLLDATQPDITEHLVIYAFEYDFKMGVLLLQHCLDLYPDNLFDHFRHISRKQVDVWEILHFILRHFTPSKAHRLKLVEKLLISNDDSSTNTEIFQLLNYRKNVKSLREISRNAVRERFQDVCETSAEFLQRVEQLEVPVVIKDLIRLKLTVRSP